MFMIKLEFDNDFFLQLIEAKVLPDKTQAAEIGIARSSFLEYKKGERTPRIDTLNRLADYYGVDARLLLKEVEL